jgi:hypothetical protein
VPLANRKRGRSDPAASATRVGSYNAVSVFPFKREFFHCISYISSASVGTQYFKINVSSSHVAVYTV